MRKALSRGHGRRSPIMTWMQENRSDLEAAFARTAPAWGVLAAYLGERGITDGDGKPPTARATRGAWARVKALPAPSAQTAPVTATVVPVPSAPVAAPSAAATPTPVASTAASGTTLAPHPRFGGPATLRNHTPAAPPAPPPPPLPVMPKQDSAAVIEAFKARGRSPGFRPPEPEPKDE